MNFFHWQDKGEFLLILNNINLVLVRFMQKIIFVSIKSKIISNEKLRINNKLLNTK